MPEYSRYVSKNYSDINYSQIKKLIHKLGIDFIDIKNVFAKNENDPLKFFPKPNSHYSPATYEMIVNEIIKQIEKAKLSIN